MKRSDVDARRPLLAAGALALALTLGACSGNDAGAPDAGASSDPHGSGQATGAPADPGGEAPGTEAATAVQAGIARAAGYNFTLSAVAGEAELEALRSDPGDALDGVVVLPAACREPLEKLNFSPAVLGAEAARTDFAAEGVDVTGSVEVARIGDRGALDAYYGTVDTLVQECSSTTLNIQEEGAGGGVVPATVPLSSSRPETDADVASALFWSRAPGHASLAQQALVLVGERGGHVAMVSFIGPAGVEDANFTAMAEAILEETLDALPGD
ncbi:hypothetical protein ACQ3I4_15375 [Zafaria sp. Z1313]|uniref:hypothetical protein n=1 Tax=unclassified Zafaria TaxID=2828765 RepID=UPI002E79D24F|nr:hypothetical protein [Zafaria sp. J156]MEE1622582.1 hypothetical protein [Zafaria sp. J156]